jgi:hypothetical protein
MNGEYKMQKTIAVVLIALAVIVTTIIFLPEIRWNIEFAKELTKMESTELEPSPMPPEVASYKIPEHASTISPCEVQPELESCQ